jgi:hypothetical protein
LTKRFTDVFTGTGPNTLTHTRTLGTFIGIVIRNDVMVLAAGFRPTTDADPVRVSPETLNPVKVAVAFTGDQGESIGKNANVKAATRRTRMGVRVGIAGAQFMIGNGAKQDPDTHPKKRVGSPRTADPREKK